MRMPWANRTENATSRQRLVPLCAVALVVGHFLFLMAWFQPAISAPDANGYFAQGRRLALEGQSWFAEESPVQYEGMHWLKSPGDRLYSRYPPGLPLVIAAVYRMAGADASLLVNPVMASLSLGLLYLLAAAWVGPGWGLLAAALMACNPVANEHALSGDSHVAAAFFMLLGLVCLERWSRGQRPGWAFATGLCLGIVPSVRYPEALCGVAFGAFVLAHLRRDARPWRSLAAGLAGAALPAAALAVRNQEAFGAFWRTGYSLTNEQTGFGLNYFRQYALGYVAHLLDTGAGPVFAVGAAGVALLCALRRTWRIGVTLALLVMPSTLLYMAYYWGGMGNGAGTMRFLLPTFFVYALATVWLLKLATEHLRGEHLGGDRRPSSLPVPAATDQGRPPLVVPALAGSVDAGRVEAAEDGPAEAGTTNEDFPAKAGTTNVMARTTNVMAGTTNVLAGTKNVMADTTDGGGRAAAFAAGAVVLALTALWGLPLSLDAMNRLESANDALARVTRLVRAQAPAGSVIVAPQQILQQLDFAGDWRLADSNTVRDGGPGGGRPLARLAAANAAPDKPSPMQREKMLDRATKFQGLTGRDLANAVTDALETWAGPKGRIFFVATEAQFAQMQNLVSDRGLIVTLDRVQMPQAPAAALGGGPGGIMGRRGGRLGGLVGPGGVAGLGGPGAIAAPDGAGGGAGLGGQGGLGGPDPMAGPGGMPGAGGLPGPGGIAGPGAMAGPGGLPGPGGMAGPGAMAGPGGNAAPGVGPDPGGAGAPGMALGPGGAAGAGGLLGGASRRGGMAGGPGGGGGGGMMGSLATGETVILAEWVR